MLPTAGGKEDRERERKKDLRMTEHESRKCSERRSGFCFVNFNKYNGSPCRRWNYLNKSFSHTSS